MMTQHIFYSWQSDTPARIGRNLVQWALERAIRTLKADAEIDAAQRDLTLDHDTQGIPGMPPLVETIFSKIDGAIAFVADLTYVAERVVGGHAPNPNVLFELGWALKSLSWRRMIGVMNSAMGHPDTHPMPFDLQHFRRPIIYHCPADASDEDRRIARAALAAALTAALRAIIEDERLRVEQRPAAPLAPHPKDVALLARYRTQLNPVLQRFLRQHSFGTPYLRTTLDPLYEVYEDWDGAAFEFHDSVLEESAAAVRAGVSAFVSLVDTYVHAMDSNPKMGSPKTPRDLRDGLQPTTMNAIRQLDSKANELVGLIDSFERTGADRIRVEMPAIPAAPDRREEAYAALAALEADRVTGGLPGLVAIPAVIIRLVPVSAFDQPRLDPASVIAAINAFGAPIIATGGPSSDERQWWRLGSRYDTDRLNPELRWRVRLVRPGFAEFESVIGPISRVM